MAEDRIVALATPEGAGPLALVRVSGAGAWRAISRRVPPSGRTDSPRLCRVSLEWRPGFAPVPAVLVPYSQGASYTGEEEVEILLPASPPLIRALLETLRREGTRAADPGEFTRRSFLNGRIDLTEAEAVAQLIAAEDRASARAVRAGLEGRLSRRVRESADRLHDLIARLEAGLDFSEQEVEPPSAEELAAEIRGVEGDVTRLLQSADSRPRERARARLLLWGRGNAGKSTLLNRLAGVPLAITSHEEGTTRDPVTAVVEWPDAPPLELVDLAGSRAGGAGSELDERARRQGEAWLRAGERVLYVLDGTRPASELRREWEELPPELRSRAWPVLNKLDLPDHAGVAAIPGAICCSALKGEGVEELREAITKTLRLGSARGSAGELLLFTDRQRGLLEQCAGELAAARRSLLEGGVFPELLVIDLRQAHVCLEEITGALSTEDTLDRIFRRFCLGK